MDGGDDAVDGVGNENGDTVGGTYSYRHTGKTRDESIISFQIFSRHIRPINDCDSRTVYLMPLDDRIRQYGIPACRESLDAGT